MMAVGRLMMVVVGASIAPLLPRLDDAESKSYRMGFLSHALYLH